MGRIQLIADDGCVLLDIDLWSLVLKFMIEGGLRYLKDIKTVRVFLDGEEVPRPPEMDDDT